LKTKENNLEPELLEKELYYDYDEDYEYEYDEKTNGKY
jgi:hypothetical protein